MAKVWVVTSGEYSDYGIEAIFSSPTLANKLVQSLNQRKGHDYADFQEWELDEINTEDLRYRFDVVIHPTTSEIFSVQNVGSYGTESPRVVEVPNYRYSVTTEMFGEKGTFSASITALRAVVYAEDESKARKAAADAIAKYKAEREGL